MAIRITNVNLDVTREPFKRPFGFKGAYFHEKWLCHVKLTSDSGHVANGLGGLAVLWSDSSVFTRHSETGGNVIMAAILEYALQVACGMEFTSPLDLLDIIFPAAHKYAQKITENKDLSRTFTLNSLVALDNAAWALYATVLNITDFDQLIDADYKQALAHHHKKLACIPLLAYGVTMDEIVAMVKDGFFFLKIKIGAPGKPDEMLSKDKERLTCIHRAVGNSETPHTSDGRIRYYLDANGRYAGKDDLCRLIDHAKKIGMFEQIVILEEPFARNTQEYVGDLGVRVAADESLHSLADVTEKIQCGYRCLALKPAGKTLSLAMQMAGQAHRHQIPCFVADSACVPVLLDWNRNFAARLAPFPGMDFGLLESNGPQNYVNWNRLMDAHPYRDATWMRPKAGVFQLPRDFYDQAGGIFV